MGLPSLEISNMENFSFLAGFLIFSRRPEYKPPIWGIVFRERKIRRSEFINTWVLFSQQKNIVGMKTSTKTVQVNCSDDPWCESSHEQRTLMTHIVTSKYRIFVQNSNYSNYYLFSLLVVFFSWTSSRCYSSFNPFLLLPSSTCSSSSSFFSIPTVCKITFMTLWYCYKVAMTT